jgi:predicted O-methyltransferase YrrM
MPFRLSREFLHDLYRTYQRDLESLTVFDDGRAFGGAYHKEERRILYMMVRHVAPELIVEFSPKHGLSTAHMALALEHNGRGGILSFEWGYRHVWRAYQNLKRDGLSHRVEFILGDVRVELPRALQRRAGAAGNGLEFVFIDSDHGDEFARWYLGALFPYVRGDGLVHIHDILTDPLAPRAGLPLSPTDEELEVRRFLGARRDDYEWLSVGDCADDAAYVAAVRPFGGGDVALGAAAAHFAGYAVSHEWNPSLWLRKRVERESEAMVPVPFTPLRPPPLKALVFRWRQHRLARMQRC